MGSDRKSKEKTTKKRRTSPSASSEYEDDGRRKKQRRGDNEEEEEDESRSNKKSHKHRSDKKKKSKDKHTTSRRDKGGHNIPKDFKELSADDYFAKNNEFSTWLKEEKNVFFSELSSESAREMFSSFMKAWNRKKLESRYYEGIVSGPRSSHNWKIKK
ncbi:hypothetical protein ACFE04_022001 [Oxalis oulophora]